ncbi:MAG: undecaprenyl-diphosphate phosphatase [Neisseriaceae bacterium]|nr:undecaprenyl-diphosphate phosphatase [Neisseriaceae bacterium]MBP6860990.1 undecaprenyl-diphosphate phosphatase [Neisseriaceae bacterium]
MDIYLFLKALILGIVEGLTEFLPVSSTGHLIVVGDLLNFQSNGKVFEIAIQLGAVLAIVFEYRSRFTHVLTHIGRDRSVNRFVLHLMIAFLPAAIVGLSFIKEIKTILFNPVSVATALVIGGIVILLIERRQANRPARVLTVEDMRAKDALVVGLAQCLALIPGTSRSGSTIMGGMAYGLDRKVATEFSFFLAVPVMFAATIFDVYKNFSAFSADDVAVIAVGFVAAFVSGLVAVRALLKFVSHRNYVPFAWYRIIFGGVILATWYFGWVSWS